jgi:hypothetical protein
MSLGQLCSISLIELKNVYYVRGRVSIVTRLQFGRAGVQFLAGALEGIYFLGTASRPTLGPTQFHNQWVPGNLSLGVKRPMRKADHSPPSSSEVKNVWSYTSIPPYVLMAWCLITQLYISIILYILFLIWDEQV